MSKVLVFGDSIARGLATYMINKYRNKHEIANAGVVGESIKFGSNRAGNYKKYDVVVLATSTNDHASAYIKSDYKNLANKLINGSPNAIIYCVNSPGKSGISLHYAKLDNKKIQAHNEEIKSVCNELNLEYIDLYNLLGDQSSPNTPYRESDNLHLNSRGYEELDKKINLNASKTKTSKSSTTTWAWPVPDSTTVSSPFGYRTQPTAGASTNHKGIDIPAPIGTPIVAVSSGKVINSGPASGYGNWIRIDHGNGIVSEYGHMKTLLVDVEEQVQIGDTIALVGNEGTSTGPHLHFEIEVNGVNVDPESFLSSNGYSIVSSDYDGSGYEESNGLPSGYYRIVDAGGVTVGQRTSGVTSQPVHAFVNIYAGEDKLLSTQPPKPNMLQSFEFHRREGAGDTMTFTVFDDNWEEIESRLCANYNQIYVEYGYYGTGLKSKRYRLLLQNYNLSFTSTGTVISVEALSEEVMKNLTPKSMVLNTFNPTEAVKEICRQLGYKVLDENFDKSEDIHADNPFNLIEDFPITYIHTNIIPQASQENEELFSFEVDSDGVAYFKREGYSTSATDNLRTYIFQKGYDTNVIDFEVDIKAVFGGNGSFNIATEYRSSVFDTKNKSQESYKVNKADTATSATGDVVHTNSKQSSTVIDSAGYTPSQMKNQLYYHMKSMVFDAYEATLTIVGDPTVEYNSFIRVINVTDEGYLHHTSGVYWVSEIIDSIQGGAMITTLKLYKNATAGDIDGVEIINPKHLIK